MSNLCELSDGSMSTKYNAGDSFIVDYATGAHKVGDVVTIKCIRHDNDFFVSDGDYLIFWCWVYPTLETRAKYSRFWRVVNYVLGGK